MPKSSVSVVLTLLLLLIFSFPLKIQAQEDFQKLLEEVEQLRKRAQLDSAISLGLDIEKRFVAPSVNAEIKIVLAKCFLDQNDWEQSLTYLDAAQQQLKV